MADEFDPDTYLEQTQSSDTRKKSSGDKDGKERERSKKEDSKKSGRRSSSRNKRRKSRSRSQSRSRRHGRRSRSRRRSHSRRRRSRSGRRSRSRERRSRSASHRRSRSRSRTPDDVIRIREQDIQADEATRETRTVFVKNLKMKVTEEDIVKYFEQVGQVRKATLIKDKAGRSRGMAYVEMVKSTDVSAALLLDNNLFCTKHPGCKCSGLAILVKPSEVEKNYAAMVSRPQVIRPRTASTKVYVSNIHSGLKEDDIKEIFRRFGEIEKVDWNLDSSGQSRDYCFVSFYNKDDAEKACEKVDGTQFGGRRIKVQLAGTTKSSTWELEDEGIPMNSKARSDLIDKIAEGKDMSFKTTTNTENPYAKSPNEVIGNVSNCILLKNLFNPSEETGSEWPKEILSDVSDECKKYGRIYHSEIDPNSMGHVYLMFATSAEAKECAEKMTGRWFGKRMLTAEYIPEGRYIGIHPNSRQAASQARIAAMNQAK